MPLFSIRCQGTSGGSHSEVFELADSKAAWDELTGVCGDLARDKAKRLRQNSDWKVELLDATGVTLFRIRLVAETFK